MKKVINAYSFLKNVMEAQLSHPDVLGQRYFKLQKFSDSRKVIYTWYVIVSALIGVIPIKLINISLLKYNTYTELHKY